MSVATPKLVQARPSWPTKPAGERCNVGRRQARPAQLTEAEAARVEDVFTTHRRFIENVARQHAPSDQDVPDIVQAVGLQLCRGLNGFRGTAQLRTWVYRVTVNAAHDHYRRERKFQRAVEAVTTEALAADDGTDWRGQSVISTDPDADAIAGERLVSVRTAIGGMRPIHRDALRDVIRNQSGAPPVQSCEERRRKSRVCRARNRLRALLANDPRFE